MSAFQVSAQHIRLLVGAWVALPSPYRPSVELLGESKFPEGGPAITGLNGDNSDDWQRAFDILASQNARSVGYRYRETTYPVSGTVTAVDVCTPITGTAAIVRILKACDCYDYQSCEGPRGSYEETAAYRFVSALRVALTRRLPGYKEAQWAINEEPNPEGTVRLFA